MSFSSHLRRCFSTSAINHKLVKPPTQVYGVPGRYATALYSAASKQNQLDAVEKDLKTIRQHYTDDTKFRAFVDDPTIKPKVKKELIGRISQKLQQSEVTFNFLGVVAENGRMKNIDSICGSFDTLMTAHRGEVSCEVTSAKPLDAATLKDLTTTLQGFVKQNEKLNISTKVDPGLIGGMTVTVGDRYVDMSIATKLRQYEKLLREAI